MEEVDGQPFDWYLADEKNMILLKNGEYQKFKPIEDHRDSRAYRVSRKIPWQSRWYLILDMIGKQYGRKVRVDFEPVPEHSCPSDDPEFYSMKNKRVLRSAWPEKLFPHAKP